MPGPTLGSLLGFVGDRPQYDDITLVALGVSLSAEDVTRTVVPGRGRPPGR